MNNFRKLITHHWSLITVLFLVVLVLTFGCKKEPKEIKIGAILPLTGDLANYGRWAKQGMELALKDARLKYPELRIKLLFEDSHGNSKEAVSSFQKLASVDRTPVVTGLLVSGEVLSVAPIAENKHIVVISTSASSNKIREAGDYIFSLRESGISHGKKMAKYIVEVLGYKTAAILFENAEHGLSYSKAFEEYFVKLGGRIIYKSSYESQNKDFRSHLVKIREVSPKAVYIAGLMPAIGLILRQSCEMGIKTQYLASAGAENPQLFEIAGRKCAEGLLFTTPAFDVTSEAPSIQRFVTEYKTSFGEDPEFIAANSYDAINLLTEVVLKVGDSPEKIKEALYNVGVFEGMGGSFSFDENGEVIKDVFVKEARDGGFRLISR